MQLSKQQKSKLSEIAKEKGCTVQELISDAVDSYLSELEDLRIAEERANDPEERFMSREEFEDAIENDKPIAIEFNIHPLLIEKLIEGKGKADLGYGEMTMDYDSLDENEKKAALAVVKMWRKENSLRWESLPEGESLGEQYWSPEIALDPVGIRHFSLAFDSENKFFVVFRLEPSGDISMFPFSQKMDAVDFCTEEYEYDLIKRFIEKSPDFTRKKNE